MGNSSNRRETRAARFNRVEHTLLRSAEYLALSADARVLMLYMQMKWHPYKTSVGFGVDEAMKCLGRSKPTAMATIKELEEAQFILLDELHRWYGNSAKNRVKEWKLTWLSMSKKSPTNDWKK